MFTAMAAMGLAGSVRGASGEGAKPFDAGSRSQVFIDRVLVRSADKIRFVLHPGQKHPAGPWLEYDAQGARIYQNNGGPARPEVIYDHEEKLFKSWSSSFYNTSKDGLRWTAKEPNDDSWNHITRPSVYKDVHDPDPARRYKVISWSYSTDHPPRKQTEVVGVMANGKPLMFGHLKGYNTHVSPDGRRLAHLSEKPLLVRGDGLPVQERINGYYDSVRRLHVAFPKTGSVRLVSPFGVDHSRYEWSVMTSPDFVNWSPPVRIMAADEEDDAGGMARLEAAKPLFEGAPQEPKRFKSEIYAIYGAIQLESCVLVMPLILTVHHMRLNGISEFQMAVSRDLVHWSRPFRQPFIPRGKVGADCQTSAWDSGWFNVASSCAINVGDEVWVYYEARNTPHDHPANGFSQSAFSKEVREEAVKWNGIRYNAGVGLVTWKKDRFVSADAADEAGTLVTVPLVFQGSQLRLNARVKTGGYVTVEILDAQDKPLARSMPFEGDALDHQTQWETPLDLAHLAGKAVSLRFNMKSAELFAFAFRP
ncbi:MAG TPA: hypothetical protein P5137_03895 [Candidatus Brocadiia bacterium]|nr:hypothetical protein [Candidatus Brocadiia bacterium]